NPEGGLVAETWQPPVMKDVGRAVGSSVPASGNDPDADPKQKDSAKKPNKPTVLWKAWKDERMSVLVQAGSLVFGGANGKVVAAQASDGKELWSASVPGKVTDLAFQGGRLLVLTDS